MIRMLRRIRGESGQSLVEFAIVLPIFLAITFITIALVMAFQARVVVTDTARAAGRYMSIHCDPGSYAYDPDWTTSTLTLVQDDLKAGALAVQPNPRPFTGSASPGQWWVQATCQGGVASIRVQYAQRNLFPPMTAVMGGGGQNGPGVWVLDISAQYPTE